MSEIDGKLEDISKLRRSSSLPLYICVYKEFRTVVFTPFIAVDTWYEIVASRYGNSTSVPSGEASYCIYLR